MGGCWTWAYCCLWSQYESKHILCLHSSLEVKAEAFGGTAATAQERCLDCREGAAVGAQHTPQPAGLGFNLPRCRGLSIRSRSVIPHQQELPRHNKSVLWKHITDLISRSVLRKRSDTTE